MECVLSTKTEHELRYILNKKFQFEILTKLLTTTINGVCLEGKKNNNPKDRDKDKP